MFLFYKVNLAKKYLINIYQRIEYNFYNELIKKGII